MVEIPNEYKRAIEALNERRTSLTETIERLKREISKLESESVTISDMIEVLSGSQSARKLAATASASSPTAALRPAYDNSAKNAILVVLNANSARLMRVSEIAEELRSTGFVSRAQQLEPVVATYLNRLMKKGLVERDESQPVYRYRLKSHSDVAVTTSEEKGG